MIMIKILIFIIIIQMMKDSRSIETKVDGIDFIIKYPEVNYSYWKSLIPYYNDDDLVIILANILICLDCSVMYSGMRIINTSQFNYERYVSEYYYYLLHISSHSTYNRCYDYLLETHSFNLKYEADNPIKEIVIKSKINTKDKTPNIYVRQETKDMFTEQVTYIYTNAKTGDSIKSDNPNLVDDKGKLIKEKKVKQPKSVGVPMTSMTFSFKKKDND